MLRGTGNDITYTIEYDKVGAILLRESKFGN